MNARMSIARSADTRQHCPGRARASQSSHLAVTCVADRVHRRERGHRQARLRSDEKREKRNPQLSENTPSLQNVLHCSYMMQRTALSQLLCRRLMSSGGTRRRVVHVPGQTKVRDFPLIYPDFLPSPVWNRRLASYEKLQRADMLERRMSIDIPEFYVDREFGRLSYRQSSSMDSHNQLYIDSSFGVLAMPYDEFDINLTDINEVEMEKIGIAEEVKHLSPGTFSDPAFPVRGIVHGPNSRLMVPLTFQRSRKPDSPVINVWCLIDTGSPFTCLSVKTLEAFFGAGNVVDGMYYPFAIQDQSTRIECQVSRVGTHFEHVNIMGIDSLRKLKLNLDIDWDKDTFELIKK